MIIMSEHTGEHDESVRKIHWAVLEPHIYAILGLVHDGKVKQG
jgi:hypothetical protein